MRNLESLIYISGSGRSGSTLVERILHSSSEVTALGELHCLWRLPQSEINCSCGVTFHDDQYWQAIVGDAGFDAATLDELRLLEANVCRSGFIARKRFSLEALGADPQVRRFLDLQFRLFDAVARASGSTVLVDSSKAGPRAWLLACDPRVRFVHIYRDPGDVIASWRSIKFDPGLGRPMKRMPVSSAALDWWKVEQLARQLARVRQVNRIDFRALCNDPRRTVGELIGNIGLDQEVSPRWLSADTVEEGSHYHSLNGNPDRFARGPIRIAARQTDWAKIPVTERPAIRAAAGALRALYPSQG